MGYILSSLAVNPLSHKFYPSQAVQTTTADGAHSQLRHRRVVVLPFLVLSNGMHEFLLRYIHFEKKGRIVLSLPISITIFK